MSKFLTKTLKTLKNQYIKTKQAGYWVYHYSNLNTEEKKPITVRLKIHFGEFLLKIFLTFTEKQ